MKPGSCTAVAFVLATLATSLAHADESQSIQSPERSIAENRTGSIGPKILIGIGGAAVVAGAAMFIGGGLASLSAADETKRAAPDATRAEQEASRMRSWGNVSTVGALVALAGGAAVGGGIAWFFVDRKTTTSARASLWIAPSLGAPGAMFGATF